MQVEAVGDAARDDVAEQAGEGALLPRRVVVRDAITGVDDLGLGQAHVAQGLLPHGALKARHGGGEQLLRAGDAEHDADALAVEVGELALASVIEHLLGDDEREELRRVRGWHDVRRDAPGHRVEVHVGQEGAALGVGLVLLARVGVVVVVQEPVARGDLGHEVGTGEDVVPEAALVDGSGEEGADADDGDGGIRVGSHGRHSVPPVL